MAVIMHRSAPRARAGAGLAAFLTPACRRFHAAAGSIARMSPRAARLATPQADAAAEGLVYVHDDQPGLRRRRHGKGFVYTDARGRRITRAAELERIRRLVIPPAYVDVWICPNPRGHLAPVREFHRYAVTRKAVFGIESEDLFQSCDFVGCTHIENLCTKADLRK